MQAENVAEYLEIRKELAALKDCITRYVGFVLVGSAAAVWGLAGRSSDGEPVQIAMALASIFLCLISICVLFLLSYKFSSTTDMSDTANYWLMRNSRAIALMRPANALRTIANPPCLAVFSCGKYAWISCVIASTKKSYCGATAATFSRGLLVLEAYELE